MRNYFRSVCSHGNKAKRVMLSKGQKFETRCSHLYSPWTLKVNDDHSLVIKNECGNSNRESSVSKAYAQVSRRLDHKVKAVKNKLKSSTTMKNQMNIEFTNIRFHNKMWNDFFQNKIQQLESELRASNIEVQALSEDLTNFRKEIKHLSSSIELLKSSTINKCHMVELEHSADSDKSSVSMKKYILKVENNISKMKCMTRNIQKLKPYIEPSKERLLMLEGWHSQHLLDVIFKPTWSAVKNSLKQKDGWMSVNHASEKIKELLVLAIKLIKASGETRRATKPKEVFGSQKKIRTPAQISNSLCYEKPAECGVISLPRLDLEEQKPDILGCADEHLVVHDDKDLENDNILKSSDTSSQCIDSSYMQDLQYTSSQCIDSSYMQDLQFENELLSAMDNFSMSSFEHSHSSQIDNIQTSGESTDNTRLTEVRFNKESKGRFFRACDSTQ
eukprot:GHVL01010382.1.p1 GENE.GHVL01010382.1~~GHVL01010382.1.p1  ORF type:complete len:445 (+),score=46.95 GHVL01010382.1:103-1437(+)